MSKIMKKKIRNPGENVKIPKKVIILRKKNCSCDLDYFTCAYNLYSYIETIILKCEIQSKKWDSVHFILK